MNQRGGIESQVIGSGQHIVHYPNWQVSMLETTILPDPKQLRLRMLVQEGDGIRAVVATTTVEARCPVCGHRCARVHSRYTRQVADVPWHGVPLRLELHLRRFFCDQPDCERRIFAERLPGVVEPYARRTVQLTEALTLLGFALGGEAGARLARRLADVKTLTSPDTLLRLVRRAVPTAAPTPRVLGVDDFAFHRGMRYGTILVDLERHQVVDLLPDREARTFATWLRAHPGVEFISRDRSSAYAEAAQQAAPAAIQIADRFHLLANLWMALDRLLTREHHVVSTVARHLQSTARLEQAKREREASVEPRPPTTRGERQHLAAEARRRARYAHIETLQQEGHSIQAIARLLGMARNTVRRYLRSGGSVEQAARGRRFHACDRFAPYLRARWEVGERNSAVLLAELRSQGYTGSPSTLRQYVMAWRTGPRRPGRLPTDAASPLTGVIFRRRTFSPRQTRWILLRPLEELDDEERTYRQQLCQQSATIAQAQLLVDAFWRLVRERHSGVHDPQHVVLSLESWLEAAAQSLIPELMSFAQGIRRDFQAVAAAFLWDYSQGQTEGQVNRLKLLKRSGFGRAKFDLLKQRVLHRSA